MKAIECLSAKHKLFKIPRRKLVVAAGPWSQMVFDELFSQARVNLDFTTDAGDRILTRNPHPIDSRTVRAMWMDDIVKEKLEFASRNDGTIWACGRRNATARLPEPGRPAYSDVSVISELLGAAKRFISINRHFEQRPRR